MTVRKEHWKVGAVTCTLTLLQSASHPHTASTLIGGGYCFVDGFETRIEVHGNLNRDRPSPLSEISDIQSKRKTEE